MKIGITNAIKSGIFASIIYFAMSLTTFASDAGSNNETDYLNDRDVKEAIKSIVDPEPETKTPIQVRIYNIDLELIRIGDEGLEPVKELISKSDFILEIGSIKIYRLNR